MKSSSLLVFINRKLISIDTIIPLLCELKFYSKEIKIIVICPDYSTLDAINKNFFIRDQINTIGSLKVLSLRNIYGKRTFLSILKCIIFISSLAKNILLYKSNFIHFGILFKKPFKYLCYFNKKNVFFAESDSYGFTQLMQDVTFMKINSPRIYPNIGSNSLIAFSKEWYLSKNINNKIYYFGTPRKRIYWQNIVKSNADKYLRKELKKNGFNPKSKIISIMLGYFGDLKYLSNKNSVYNCLEESIQMLSECIKDEVIVLKPHVITDLDLLNNLLAGFKNTKFLISNLHPMLLATRSKFAIANYYSTTLSDFNSLGVKTIEYTDYNNKALLLTNGGSLRPDKVDFFINKDQIELKIAINKLLKTSYNKNINYNTENIDNLFGALNGKKL